MRDKIVLLGAGGHCKVAADILNGCFDIVGITDADITKHGKSFYGIQVIGNDDVLSYLYINGVSKALITVGSVKDNSVRKKLYCMAKNIGFDMINMLSLHAIVSGTVRMGSGNVIMDGAVVHADTTLSDNIIINTGAIVEHDCIIENHVHVSIGAKLAGGVRVCEGAYIGMGSSIIQGVTIGKNCVIGAGAVVIDDIPDDSMAAGVPARVLKKLYGG